MGERERHNGEKRSSLLGEDEVRATVGNAPGWWEGGGWGTSTYP